MRRGQNNSKYINQAASIADLLSPQKKRPSATDMSGIGGSEVGRLVLIISPLVPYMSLLQGYIVVGYRGTFAFGRDMSDVKFRKLTRILVHGKSVLCREVFKVPFELDEKALL